MAPALPAAAEAPGPEGEEQPTGLPLTPAACAARLRRLRRALPTNTDPEQPLREMRETLAAIQKTPMNDKPTAANEGLPDDFLIPRLRAFRVDDQAYYCLDWGGIVNGETKGYATQARLPIAASRKQQLEKLSEMLQGAAEFMKTWNV